MRDGVVFSMAPICPYCGAPSKPTTGREVYPHLPQLANVRLFACMPCRAWVGCHADGRPLGELANAELRQLRQRCHALFDALWLRTPDQHRVRAGAYAWLREELGLTCWQAHFGMMDRATAKRALALLAFGGLPGPDELRGLAPDDDHDHGWDEDSPGGWHHEDARPSPPEDWRKTSPGGFGVSDGDGDLRWSGDDSGWGFVR